MKDDILYSNDRLFKHGYMPSSLVPSIASRYGCYETQLILQQRGPLVRFYIFDGKSYKSILHSNKITDNDRNEMKNLLKVVL